MYHPYPPASYPPPANPYPSYPPQPPTTYSQHTQYPYSQPPTSYSQPPTTYPQPATTSHYPAPQNPPPTSYPHPSSYPPPQNPQYPPAPPAPTQNSQYSQNTQYPPQDSQYPQNSQYPPQNLYNSQNLQYPPQNSQYPPQNLYNSQNLQHPPPQNLQSSQSSQYPPPATPYQPPAPYLSSPPPSSYPSSAPYANPSPTPSSYPSSVPSPSPYASPSPYPSSAPSPPPPAPAKSVYASLNLAALGRAPPSLTPTPPPVASPYVPPSPYPASAPSHPPPAPAKSIYASLNLAALGRATPPPPVDKTNWQTKEIYDPNAKMRVGTFKYPTGWTVQSGIIPPNTNPHNKNSTAKQPAVVFEAILPDRSMGVQVMPQDSWVWTNDPMMRQVLISAGAEVTPLLSAAEYLKKKVLPTIQPPMQLVSEAVHPYHQTIKNKVEADFAKLRASAGASAPNYSLDTARLCVRNAAQGTEGFLECGLATFSSPPSLLPPAPQQVNVLVVLFKWARQGELEQNDNFLDSISDSFTTDPAWVKFYNPAPPPPPAAHAQNLAGADVNAEIARIHREIAADNMQHAIARGNMMRDANKQTYNAINQSAALRSQASHKAAKAFALQLNDQREYLDPTTGKTLVGSNQYNQAYSDGLGTVVYSNDATFNPNASLYGNWSQLRPTWGN